MENSGKISSIKEMAKSTVPFSTQISAIDKKPLYLTCPNGTIDLELGCLIPAEPGDLITMTTAVPYNPDAKAPRWQQFLREIFIHPDGTPYYDLIQYVKKLAGMSLTGKVDRILLLCYGVGANGKSVLFKIFQYVLGDYAASSSFHSLVVKDGGTGNELARLRGKRLVTAVETQESQTLNEAKVKLLTGGDPVVCRFLYQEYFEYYPEFKLWLACNHKPRIRGADAAIWDRVKLIPFNARFEGQADDKNLFLKLKDEAEGILAWMVEGCQEWQDEGQLEDCPTVKEASRDYRQEDVFQVFIDERIKHIPGAFIPVTAVTVCYNNWALKNGEQQFSTKIVGKKMAQKGFQRVTKDNVRGYWGIDTA
jgi:putative DNA primase/helicase